MSVFFTLFYLALFTELLIVSMIDLYTKKISNLWAISNLLFAVILYSYVEHYVLDKEIIVFPLAFLGTGLLLFRLKIMGAGDVKFLSTFFLLLVPHLQERLFYYLVASTVVVAVTFLVFNTLKNSREIIQIFQSRNYGDLKKFYGTKFSYAPVILLSWIMLGLDIFGGPGGKNP
jgi:prepilin peptidase CpaA